MITIEALEIAKTNVPNETLSFKKGMVTGFPIAVGYIPIAITFGLLAKTSGIPDYTSLLMSLIVFAGASQFVGVNLLVLGASAWEIIFTTFILNFRHFLMTASISQRLEANLSKKWLSILSFGITDETFMILSMRNEEKLPSQFVLGVNLAAFSSWNIGTWIGVFLGTGLPSAIQESMGIALYSMFIGLLVPSIKKSRSYLIISLFAIGINSFIHWFPLFSDLSGGWAIILTTITAALIGAFLFSKEEDPS